MAQPMTEEQTGTQSQSAEMDEAISIVCARHLHQRLWLPANASHGRLRITFSTTSNFADKHLPVVFISPPMFGGRSMSLSFDHTAKSIGVRIISVDRPGMGGSTPVPLNMRVPVWLEIVPAILQYLDVEYIDALFCHSAGTIYALNTLYHLRDRLNPRHPYVAIIAPWVDYKHGSATLMNVASKLPAGLVGSLHNVTKFINSQVMPVTSWSGGVVSSVSSFFQTSPDEGISDPVPPHERYGTSEEVGAAIQKLAMRYYFAEDTSGGSEEAKLCLKKCEPGSWGACEDYMQFVRTFVEQERSRIPSETEQTGSAKLKVEVYFAESDMMTGKAGQTYFADCWRQAGVEDVVQFDAIDLPDTNHETAIVDLEKGPLRRIFEEVTRLTKTP